MRLREKDDNAGAFPLIADLADTSGWGTMQPADGGAIECLWRPARNLAELFYRTWRSGRPDQMMIIHGLGGHSGWYIDLGNSLSSRGLDVIAPDLRGFGRSDGLRGHISRGPDLIDDLDELALAVGKTPGKSQLHILGHSMGAVLAVFLTIRLSARGDPPTSLSLVNPWVEDARGVPPLTVLQVAAQGLIGSRRLWRLGGGPDTMTDNPAAREYLEQDPYWTRDQTAAFLFQILLLRMKLLRAARQVQSPTLVIQTGGDSVVRHHASRRLFDRIGTSRKEWAAPPNFPHDFQFSEDRGEVDAMIAGWAASHRR